MLAVKTIVYGRFQLLGAAVLVAGLVPGCATIAGSWTGKRVIVRMPRERFVRLVEVLLAVLAIQWLATAFCE